MKRLVLLLLVVVPVCAPPAVGATTPPPRWATTAQATIHPGVQTYTEGRQCTSNFVFYDSRSVYLGQAAHCSSVAGLFDQADGCTGHEHPLGTPVRVQGASHPATLVYSAYLTMKQRGESRPAVCEGNDFALIRLHPADVPRVNPSVPFWGGPVGSGGRSATGERAYTYGNSEYRGGVTALMPRAGVNTSVMHTAIEDVTGWGAGKTEWRHYITTVTPTLFGDSGSPFLDAGGRALGVLSGFSLDGSTMVVDLPQALRYMKANTKLDAVTLAAGTTPFAPPK